MYGTEDKIDDVIDFYKAFLDSKNIVLDKEDIEDRKCSAKGFFENIIFKINAVKANGKYEEKYLRLQLKWKLRF